MGRHRIGRGAHPRVLILYGWVPAGLVSLAVVSLVGAARRHRWRQGLLHGSVDILGIGAGALVLAAFGETPTVEAPWLPTTWGLDAVPEIVLVAVAYLLATRVLLWIALAPRGAGLPTVARTALLRQALVAVALLGIAPLIGVVAITLPVLLPLFAVPLIALDSTLWIARARAEEQLRDPLTGLPNRQWLLERAWSALDEAERLAPGPRSSSSTSTASGPSTTPSATWPATGCCSRSPTGCARPSPTTRRPPGSAATSSPSCSPWPTPPPAPSGSPATSSPSSAPPSTWTA